MWLRRLWYGLALLAAFLLQIFNTHYLAAFCFWGVLSLPVLSLLLSLPTLLACRLTLEAVPAEAVRGQAARWEVALRGGRMPLARVAFTLRLRHSADGREERIRRVFSGAEPRERWVVALAADHCEVVEGEILSAWASDLLRLFSLPLGRPGRQTMLVLPVGRPPNRLPWDLGIRFIPATAPRPGRQLGEEYELRSYRPGDPVRAIHWKLSSKRDELIVRESSRRLRPTVLITADRFGGADRGDEILDRLLGWSQALLRQDIPHVVQWVHPVTGELRTCRVESGDGQRRCLAALLADPCPREGKTVLDIPLGDRWQGEGIYPIHILPEEEEKDGQR